VIFLMRCKRKQKNIREKASFQPRMTWWLGRISDRHISQRMHGRTIFSMWSPIWRTVIDMFTVPFVLHAKRMVIFFWLLPFFYLLVFINIFNWQHFYLASYSSWTRAKPDRTFCWNTCAKWWPPKKDATVHG
jgi:cellulose synthase/poly-beta-1,6-N-acetylglucosamine synthase-like glycosyltransferase